MMKINVKNFKLAALVTATAAFMVGTPVSAAEFTTSDSVLTLQIPDDDWKQVNDNQTWVTLTDGNDQITLQHYSNGEKLPELLIAGDDYAQVCQNIISTENEVFIITGAAADKADFEEVREAVQSVVINKYDTKTAMQPENGKTKAGNVQNAGSAGSTAQTGSQLKDESHSEDTQETAEAGGFTVWVTSQQLNVRAEGSTSAAILGTVYYMDALEVTGIVKAGGAETGWYQVSYNGTVGYVASEYTSAIPSTAETSGYTLTDEQVTLYTEDGESAAYVYKATNGNWYDGSGRQYQPDESGQWTCLTSGSTWTETAPQTPADNAVSQVEVTDEEGYNSQTLYLGDAGVWQNIAGGIYTDGGNGTWIGSDGTVWHEK